MEDRNKRKRGDVLVDVDLLPRLDASRLCEWHIEVSTVLRIKPYFAELLISLTDMSNAGHMRRLALLLCAANPRCRCSSVFMHSKTHPSTK